MGKGLKHKARSSPTRKDYGRETNSIAKKGQGALPLAESRGSASGGVWGNAPTVPRATYSKEEAHKSAGSEASLPVTLRVLRRAPQLALPTTCTVSRQMGATAKHERLFSNDNSIKTGSCPQITGT